MVRFVIPLLTPLLAFLWLKELTHRLAIEVAGLYALPGVERQRKITAWIERWQAEQRAADALACG